MTAPGPILALDCSGAACSAALWRDGAVAARRWQALERGHGAALLPMAEAVLAEAGLGFAGLALVAATVGPGAFTGLRIGLAAARGIALAAGLPFAGVTSFAAIAEAAATLARPGAAGLWVALDSKRGDLFVQRFRDGAPAGPPAILAPAALAAALPAGPAAIAGDAAGLLRPVLAGRPGLALIELPAPDAAAVAVLAARLAAAAPAALVPGGVLGLPPTPLYLRPAEVTRPAAPP
ncbi:MAG: tRNA (adenosine(37)-N6)-threonylcarbamoyltransferase complex dimerization subunit type 1 TsaB [Dongiaceae bacterium]